MKISQVLYSGMGGHGSVAFSISEGDSNNLDRHSFIFYGVEPVFKDYSQKCKRSSFEFDYVKKTRFRFNYLELFQVLKKQRPTHIILHSTQLIVPVIIYSIINRAVCVSVEHQNNSLKRIQDKLSSILCILLASKVICLTEQYLEELKANFISRMFVSKFILIPNGVNTHKFCNQNPKNHEGLNYCMISRLNSLKDHSTLLQATEIICKQTLLKVKLYIVGDGATRQKIEQDILELNLSETVELTGPLDEDGIINILSKCQLYIHCSKGETMSMSILQAMSMRVPVIASNVAGIGDLFSRENIYLVEENNPIQLSNSILSLHKDEEKRNELSENSRKLILREYSAQKIFKMYRAVFLSLN